MTIVAGLDQIFDRHLQVTDIGSWLPHYCHKSSAKRLSEGPPAGFDAKALVEEAYARLAANLGRSPRFGLKGPSKENWRFRRQPRIAPHNSSPAVKLERAIARQAGPDWANQVPTASGLWDHAADKRRAVDLVHRRAPAVYELIELKVESNTPLAAAIAIVQHALLYLLAREHYPEAARRSGILAAREVHLRVLAPRRYYADFQLGSLEGMLDGALRRLSRRRLGSELLSSFAFEAFPPDFDGRSLGADILPSLQGRAPIWSGAPGSTFGDDPSPSRSLAPETASASRKRSSVGSPRAFGQIFKGHSAAWARREGLVGELDPRRPWVLRDGQLELNFFRPEWAAFIAGREHLWARALNSSQCFAVNLFAPLADDAPAALSFLRALLPDRALRDGDSVRVEFEQCPEGVAQRVGERGKTTQIDVLLKVVRDDRLHAAVGIEVKLTEAFGECRGAGDARDGQGINPEPQRCLDGAAVFEGPASHCFMAQSEGRRYWEWMSLADGSFAPDALRQLPRCAFRHGLYQLMRNRVALDVLRSLHGSDWCEFAVCVHQRNHAGALLPEPVGGHEDALDAFEAITKPGALIRWDPLRVVEGVEASGAAPEGWGKWMRERYLLNPDQEPLAEMVPRHKPLPREAPPPRHSSISARSSRLDEARSDMNRIEYEREVRKRLAAFLAVANRLGIEKIGPKIEAVFLGRAESSASKADIKRQLRRWVDTNPDGRYARAIPAARALYDLLLSPE